MTKLMQLNFELNEIKTYINLFLPNQFNLKLNATQFRYGWDLTLLLRGTCIGNECPLRLVTAAKQVSTSQYHIECHLQARHKENQECDRGGTILIPKNHNFCSFGYFGGILYTLEKALMQLVIGNGELIKSPYSVWYSLWALFLLGIPQRPEI